jgi:hypothetical protein
MAEPSDPIQRLLLPDPGTGTPVDVVNEGNQILDANRTAGGLHDVQGIADALYAKQQQDPQQAQQLQTYIEGSLLPIESLQLPQALATAQRMATAQPSGTTHPVAITPGANASPAQVREQAYREMAQRAGLSPEATQEFVTRAGTLDGGQLHGASTDPTTSGPVVEAQPGARIEVAPNSAQAGLLKLLASQDAARADNIELPSGAAAGIPFTPQAGGHPGNTAVTPEIASEILRNVSEGKPPFKPELGQVGGVSWFVTEGNPHVGVGNDKSVTLPVEIDNKSGKPVVEFNEAKLLEIYNAKVEGARTTVEQQVREASGKTNGEPLSNRNVREIERRTSQLAERQMWTEVGQRVAQSESGVGRVKLENSMFSRSANGEFMLTSHAENVRIKGGTQALLDVIKSKGTPVEPEVLKSAQDLATKEGWAGKVQGAFRVGGKVLIVVGLATDAYRIYTAEDKVKTVVEVAGGWAGAAAAGGTFAAAFAPADAAGPFAWAVHGVGTLVAGGIGYWAGSETARTIYELAVEGKPIEIGG